MTTSAEMLRMMFDHHLWATGALIHHLEGPPPQRLDDAVQGTTG